LIEIVECLNAQGRSPYQEWFYSLDPQAAAIVTVVLERLADGNMSRVKPIGEGAAEIRIDRGPGYRILFRLGRQDARGVARRRHQAPATE
jgi:putative addiction module killer protein